MSKVRCLGSSDFPKMRKSNGLFVDKSMLIKEVFDSASDVMLITRPRRFGKSLNMNMIYHFLTIEVDKQGNILPEDLCENRKLFFGGEVKGEFNKIVMLQPLKISCDPIIQGECGKHPVIFVSFKGVEGMTYDDILGAFSNVIRNMLFSHYYLSKSDKLVDEQRTKFKDYLNPSYRLTSDMIADSLRFLTDLLYTHFNEKVWILIDEYDAPLNNGYVNLHREGEVADFKRLRELVSTLMTSVLKDNPQVHRAVVTGIFRLAKTEIFSKLNNVQEYSIFNEELAEFYGFTQDEVDQLLKDSDFFHTREEVKRWYNGYIFGGLEIYNPWSIMSFIASKGKLRAYWLDTGSTRLFDPQFIDNDLQEKLLQLRNGESIRLNMPHSISFESLISDTYFFYMLLISGYFKPTSINFINEMITCKISVVNLEIMSVFTWYTTRWMEHCLQTETMDYISIIAKILSRDTIDEFASDISEMLSHSVSYFDVAKNKAEVFYAGFMTSMLCILEATHTIHREIESGNGRADVIILPRDYEDERVALVIEYKIAKNLEELDTVAQQGLEQIVAKKYDTFIQQHDNIKDIIHVSFAFYKKDVCVKYA